MQDRRHTGFTLVELIVVVTILAILATIGFVSYSSYLIGVRDTNRITQLENIRSGLQSYSIKGNPLLPADYVTVKDGIKILGYQGYAGEDVLDSIGLERGGIDPGDDSYYTYYLSKSRNRFQLLGFLEEQGTTAFRSGLANQTHAIDYSIRYPIVTGESLGVFVGTAENVNVPIQSLNEITVTSNGILDVSSTTSQYTAIINDNNTITGDNSELGVLSSLANSGGYIGISCKDLITARPGLYGENDTYVISPGGELLEVYCDMIVDGGGWTLYTAKAAYGFSSDGNMASNLALKDNLIFGEFMGIFTSPSGTIASYRYDFFSNEEAKRAFTYENGTGYDNSLWGGDATIHYSSPEELANAVDITEYDTTGVTTGELRGYIEATSRNYFSGWVRSSNNEVGLGRMTFATYYHGSVKNNYLWFPHSPYNSTWRVGSDTFASELNWTDGRSISIWLR